jgi:hypothetical protein
MLLSRNGNGCVGDSQELIDALERGGLIRDEILVEYLHQVSGGDHGALREVGAQEESIRFE